jgi:endoglucanase Acf2
MEIDTDEAVLINQQPTPIPRKSLVDRDFILCSFFLSTIFSLIFFLVPSIVNSDEKLSWSSVAQPFSITDPKELGFVTIARPQISQPGPVFDLLHDPVSIAADYSYKPSKPLPTNTWYQNLLLGKSNNNIENKVFQVPYILDTAGGVPGIRTHAAHVQANDRAVMVSYLNIC